jgi:hypothetical protein
LNLYEKVLVGAARWDFTVLGTGVAFIDRNQVVAERVFDEDGSPRMLFSGEGPKFLHSMVVDSPTGTMVYAYGEDGLDDCNVDVYLARAPLEQAHERSAWRFWSGDGWRREPDAARSILQATEGGIGSVAWNDHLGAFVAGTMGLCTPGADFVLREAPHPSGPWSEPVAVDFSAFGATAFSYAGMIHPALGSERRIVASFYQPQVRDAFPVGKVQLVALQLERRRSRGLQHWRRGD